MVLLVGLAAYGGYLSNSQANNWGKSPFPSISPDNGKQMVWYLKIKKGLLLARWCVWKTQKRPILTPCYSVRWWAERHTAFQAGQCLFVEKMMDQVLPAHQHQVLPAHQDQLHPHLPLWVFCVSAVLQPVTHTRTKITSIKTSTSATNQQNCICQQRLGFYSLSPFDKCLKRTH